MPVLGSTAGFVRFKSLNDKRGHTWRSTSLAIWSLTPCICTSGSCNGPASTFDDLSSQTKKRGGKETQLL